MNFNEAMYEVLQTRRYDVLTGRRLDIWRTIGSWFEELVIWIVERLNLPNIDAYGLGDGVRTVAIVFAIVGLVLVVVAGVVLVRTFLRGKQQVNHDISDIFAELTQKNYTVSELLTLSQTAENKRLAVRYRYIAVLLALDEKDIINISPSATNRIILMEIQAAAPNFAIMFNDIADMFHKAWFGKKTVTDEDFGGFVNAVDHIVSKEG